VRVCSKPSAVAEKLQERLPFKIGVQHVVRAWQKLGCRPPPDQIILSGRMKCCIYDEPHKDYLFTQAFIDKLPENLALLKSSRHSRAVSPLGRVPRPSSWQSGASYERRMVELGMHFAA
jgi:hypothetical protein